MDTQTKLAKLIKNWKPGNNKQDTTIKQLAYQNPIETVETNPTKTLTNMPTLLATYLWQKSQLQQAQTLTLTIPQNIETHIQTLHPHQLNQTAQQLLDLLQQNNHQLRLPPLSGPGLAATLTLLIKIPEAATHLKTAQNQPINTEQTLQTYKTIINQYSNNYDYQNLLKLNLQKPEKPTAEQIQNIKTQLNTTLNQLTDLLLDPMFELAPVAFNQQQKTQFDHLLIQLSDQIGSFENPQINNWAATHNTLTQLQPLIKHNLNQINNPKTTTQTILDNAALHITQQTIQTTDPETKDRGAAFLKKYATYTQLITDKEKTNTKTTQTVEKNLLTEAKWWAKQTNKTLTQQLLALTNTTTPPRNPLTLTSKKTPNKTRQEKLAAHLNKTQPQLQHN